MHGPDGTVYRGGGTYREIRPPDRIVFETTILDDGDAELARILNIIVLVERSGKTELSLTCRVLHAEPIVAPHLAGMEPGWSSSLECLAEYLERPGARSRIL